MKPSAFYKQGFVASPWAMSLIKTKAELKINKNEYCWVESLSNQIHQMESPGPFATSEKILLGLQGPFLFFNWNALSRYQG